MLIQLIAQNPQMLGPIVSHTPVWVWGLLAGLLALGLGQVRDRSVALRRVTIMPLVMIGLSLWGTVTVLARSPHVVTGLLVWLAAAAATLATVASIPTAAGTRFDPAQGRFAVPGSWVPLALIVGIFLTKYAVGVDLAMQPALGQDGQYTLIVTALYGAFSGIFAGRAARLWRLALRPSATRPSASTVTA